MAPAASVVQATTKVKRPMAIQTNGINSSTSSPSPSMSAGRLPSGPKYPSNSATSNGGGNSAGVRSANRARPGQLLGRGQRNNSAGLRSGSVVGELAISQVAQTQPYVKSDAYILKKYRGNPPSLIIHLHATHFRFDQQEGSFSYKSPMKLLLEHIRQRTVPHELIDFFTESDVAFYEGCMIVQIHDHKSTAPPQGSSPPKTTDPKSLPFSVHKYNACVTPSPYVPYPNDNTIKGKASADENGDGSSKSKTSAQQDKENMPAPAFPNDGQRNKSASAPNKAKVITVVLHPTPLSTYIEIVHKAITPRATELRQERSDGSTSATLAQPPTPLGAVPPTPSASMPPPAKRLKRAKMELEAGNIYAAEAQIILATTAPLALDPAGNAVEASKLLEALAHPLHSDKPPQPKTRKRTVAEMAADEAQAADEERYMLILDERLSASITGAQGSANVADGDGQAGGASFEPRFEKFKTLENIKHQIAERKAQEKLRQAEADRKSAADREIQRAKEHQEARQKEMERRSNLVAQQTLARQQQQQQDSQRRALAAQQQQQQQQHPQAMQAMPPNTQGPHAHPNQPNGIMPNGMQSQPQRFQQQQSSQAQISSPIVRNGTPHSHSSPNINNGMGSNHMQHSTSSMGGSPPRPGSVVQQNHPQMGAPTSHGMVPQRSQQSHAGTPRMPSATPNVQSTPLNRGMSATPRMSQASPLQGAMAQAPQMGQMGINQQTHVQNMHNMNSTQQQQYLIQMRAQQAHQQQQLQHQHAQSLGMMQNGQQMTPQQMMAQQQMRQLNQGSQVPGTPLAQSYQNHLAAMAQRSGGIPHHMNMNQGFMNNGMNMQNLAVQQQMQQHQLQQQQQQQHQQQQMMNVQISQYMTTPQGQAQFAAIYRQYLQKAAERSPGGIVPDAVKPTIQKQAQAFLVNQLKSKIVQSSMQHSMQQPNGMNMGRPQGM